MGSFSIWHWIIVLTIIGGIIFLVTSAVRNALADKSELCGIAGWLALLAFGQVMGLLRVIATVFQNFGTYGPVINMPGGKIAIYTEVAMNFCLVALMITTTFALFKKKKYFIRLFAYQWIAFPVIFILNVLIVSSAFGVSASALVTSEDVRTTILAFVAGGIWVWYTRASIRVANTMVN